MLYSKLFFLCTKSLCQMWGEKGEFMNNCCHFTYLYIFFDTSKQELAASKCLSWSQVMMRALFSIAKEGLTIGRFLLVPFHQEKKSRTRANNHWVLFHFLAQNLSCLTSLIKIFIILFYMDIGSLKKKKSCFWNFATKLVDFLGEAIFNANMA